MSGGGVVVGRVSADPCAVGTRAPTVFRATREPEPTWQSALARIAPKRDRATWLAIWWEPGETWAPIQRWMIYRMTPRAALYPDLLAELTGPSPRSSGRYSERLDQWVDGPCHLITHTQWQMFRALDAFATPYWVVQGDGGGHVYRLTRWQARVSILHGGPADTPFPGELPYAEPDARTWESLGALRRDGRKLAAVTQYGLARPWELTGDDKAGCEYAARQLLGYFGVTAEAHADELTHALRRDTTIPRPAAGTPTDRTDYDHLEATILHEAARDLASDTKE